MSTPTTYTVRASSWGKLFDCAYAWEGAHLLGIRKPAGIRALLGTALHRSTAIFDQGRVDHSAVTPDDAASVLVDTIHHPDYDVDLTDDDINTRQAESIGLALHSRYCVEWSPRYEFAAVEMATEPLVIDCGGGTHIKLTGTLDRSRVIVGAGKDRIADVKSGKTAVQQGRANTKQHRPQVGTYQLLYEHTTGRQTDDASEVIGLKTSGKPEIATGEMTGARDLMVGTTDYPGLMQIAAQMFATGLFPPNPSSTNCHPKYCPRWQTCPYHG